MDINKNRLYQHIQELGKIGKQEDGSITRLAFYEDDEQACKLIQKWMLEAGLKVSVDACGNVIGELRGSDSNLKPILCGSHIDSVIEGGMFDGCLGVLSGIEAAQTIIEKGYTLQRSVFIIVFRDEEGNRFGYGMVGSKSIAGICDEEGLLAKDHDGISLREAMQEKGYHPDEFKSCYIDAYEMLELHIEQAGVLEKQKAQIGIVQGIAGLERYTITIHGVSGHSGAIPMSQRHDPVCAMSKWIVKINEYALSYPSCVATVGSIQTYPGTFNIICNHVVFTLDIRSIYKETMTEILAHMKAFESEYLSDMKIEWKKEQALYPCLCDKKTQSDIEQICKEEHIDYLYMMSGAGHDTMNFRDVCPCAMIFVPSTDGASHKKEEFTNKEDCAAGAQVLYRLICTHGEIQ